MSNAYEEVVIAALMRVEAFNDEQRAKQPKNWRQRAGLSEAPKPPLFGWERQERAVNAMLNDGGWE